MMRYEDLMRMRRAELAAEVAENRAAEQLARMRRAERRYRKAENRLVSARLRVSYAS